MLKDGMEEKIYRQSRLCRLLGNPMAFAVVSILGETKELSPSEIARAGWPECVAGKSRVGGVAFGRGRSL